MPWEEGLTLKSAPSLNVYMQFSLLKYTYFRDNRRVKNTIFPFLLRLQQLLLPHLRSERNVQSLSPDSGG